MEKFQEYNIKQAFTTPRYAQSYGQAKATNKIILNFLMKKLDELKKLA